MKSFTKQFLLLFIMAVSISCFAQDLAVSATDSFVINTSSNGTLIDGGVTPELIPDSVAYRLYCLFLRSTENGTEVQTEKLNAAGVFNQDDVVYMKKEIVDFALSNKQLKASVDDTTDL